LHGTVPVLLEGRAAAPDATDAQTLDDNRRWIDWVTSLANEGKLAAGGPLEATARAVTRDGAVDRPLADVDTYGFLLVEADSLEEATDLAGQAPNVALGGSAVVRPVPDVPLG
jgi:hypothetical protein